VKITISGKLYYLHHAVTDFKFKQLDHRNGLRYDCRKENLREATATQNKHNRTKCHNNKSGYKGVCFIARVNRWQASIGYEGKNLHLGNYTTAELAHEAYCKKALELFGEFANFG
jgi:hypothetical protein